MYSTPRGKTDKLEEPVNGELNIKRTYVMEFTHHLFH